jgi:LAO/AO transport system kinase
MDVFFRSMSARGSLGGLSTATTDAVTALDAFGKDRVIIETVGAGQNEIDIVRTADTVAVLVPPDSGDDVQMLKAGILEIADLFAVNKADLDGADRTVQQLKEMLHYGDRRGGGQGEGDDETEPWEPPVIETVANTGEGVEAFLTAVDDHLAYLDASGKREAKQRSRYAAEIRTLLREDANDLLEREIERRGGIDADVDEILAREADPYGVTEEIVRPLRECLEDRRE